MSKPEFDEFFYNNSIVDLISALDIRKSDLLPAYDKDRLYCPECHIARLKFVAKTNNHRAYLSTWPPSKADPNIHDDNCFHKVKRASKKETKEYYKELSNGQIQDKLQSEINLFLREHSALPLARMNLDNMHPGIAMIKTGETRTRKRIPRRNIFSIYDLKEDEYNIPILFYGTVKLKRLDERTSDNREYHRLAICGLAGKPFIRFMRGREIDLINQSKKYRIAIIAIITLDDQGNKRYDLYTKDSIRYIEI